MIISPTMRAAVGLWVLFAGFPAVFSHSLEYVHLEPDQSTSVPDGWEYVEKVAEDEPLMLTFALKQQNVDQLEAIFWSVSDPDDESYGDHLSLDDIAAIVQPSDETITEVGKWLEMAGVTECSTVITNDFLDCSLTVRQAQSLLGNVQFNKYTDGERTVIRSEVKYQVPKHLHDHLDFVGGVHRFPSEMRLKTEDMGNHSVDGIHIGVYPKILRQRYNLTNSDVGSHPNNSQCVAQFLEQYFHNGDLSEFFSLFVGGDFVHQWSIDKIIGPNGWKSGVEASLDTQYIMGLGANITTWFWSTGGRHEKQEPFLKWLLDVGNTSVVPPVHSVSYGEGEITLSKTYMVRINTEFMKLGARGVTILFASGDDGANCKHGRFSPAFPASSPYVTAVGGTAFYNPFTVGEEKAYDISGGGFSDTFKQPSYQAEAVAAYLNSSKVPDKKYFDPKGRAYPDLAAICRHFWIVNNRIPVPGVMGTSASTPTVAGIISMVNEHRLQAGKPVMGFLNPFIYKHPQAFYDVTAGYNSGCQSGDVGFYATKGFDPVTGYGTPNYPELVKAAMK